MTMTMNDKMDYDNSTLARICNEELGEGRVRDHNPPSGKIRGSALEDCNKKYKVPTLLSVVFHNYLAMIVTYFLKHWEIAKEIFHEYQIMKKITFLLRIRSSLTNLLTRREKKVNERRELRFIDSLRLMALSHDKLPGNLKIDKFVNFMKYNSGNQLSLLLRKGVYPCDYVDFMKKIDEARSLLFKTHG